MQKCPIRIKCQSDKLNTIDKDKKPTYISMADAKKILYLSDSTIRYHLIRKRIRAFKSAGKWWLNSDDVKTFKKWSSQR
jgi:hypothetical protein